MSRRWLTWFLSAPLIVGPLLVMWAAFQMWGASPLAAIVIAAVALVWLALSIRRIRSQIAPAEDAVAGELSSAHFSYIMWVAIGMPFVIVALLLWLLITGGLTRSN